MVHCMSVGSQRYSITSSDKISSEEELQRELCTLFESAHRNGVSIKPISTWVCRHDHIPDKELMVTELAKR